MPIIYLRKEKFIEAEPHMSNFLSNKNNSEYNFKYGVCVLFKYADKSKSIPYLEKAIKDPDVDPRAYFYLGRVYHYNYLFQDALNQYENTNLYPIQNKQNHSIWRCT